MRKSLTHPLANVLARPLGLALLILAADQLTKWLVLRHLSAGPIEILPFFNLVLVWNPGVSFGLFPQGSAAGVWFLITLSLAICAIMFIWLLKQTQPGLRLAIAAVIGGAIGNIIDRAVYGAVVDFLDFHAFGWHYPAFNIADSAIVLGIAFILFDSLWLEPKRQQTGPEPEEKLGQQQEEKKSSANHETPK